MENKNNNNLSRYYNNILREKQAQLRLAVIGAKTEIQAKIRLLSLDSMDDTLEDMEALRDLNKTLTETFAVLDSLKWNVEYYEDEERKAEENEAEENKTEESPSASGYPWDWDKDEEKSEEAV